MLDKAAVAWPDLAGDRKTLLLRLAELGAEQLTVVEVDLGDALADHVGEWVAVRDGTVLTADPSAERVAAWLRAHGERAEQVFLVPSDPDADLGEHGLA